MEAIGEGDGHMAGIFPGHQVAVSVGHILAHLDEPAEAVHEVDIDALSQHIFALPGEGTGGLPVGISAEGKDRAGLVMLGLGGVFPGIIDADDIVSHLGDAGCIGEGADVGAEIAGHLIIGMIADDGVGIVVAGGGPVGVACVRAQLAGPDQGIAGDLIGEAFGDVELRVVCAGGCDGQLRDGGNGEVPGEVLQRDVLGLDHGQRHHVAVHHEQRTAAVDGQVPVLLNEQADGFDGVFDGVGVGSVVLPGQGVIFVDVILAPGELQGNGLTRILIFSGCFQCSLNGPGTVCGTGGVGAIVHGIEHNCIVVICRADGSGQGRQQPDDHAQKQGPCQESVFFPHIVSSFACFLRSNRRNLLLSYIKCNEK